MSYQHTQSSAYANDTYSAHSAHAQHSNGYGYTDNTGNAYQSNANDGGMTGVGARRMAQKQQERQARQQRQEEEERRMQREWQAEQDRMAKEDEEAEEATRRRWYDEQRRAQEYEDWQRNQRQRQNDVVREERRLYDAEQQEHKRQEVSKQEQWRTDEQNARQRQQEDDAERERYAHRERATHEQSRNDENDFWSSSHSSQAFQRRAHTDSQATARPLRQQRGSDTTGSVPDGFGGWQARTVEATDSRATVTDDAYEERDQPLPRSRDSEGMWQQRQSARSSLAPEPREKNNVEHRPVIRETVYETLPKATCADCGEQLPFDDLVDHTCVRDACRSPLLAMQPSSSSSLGSSSNSLQTNSATPSPSDSYARSPFFERYELAQRDDGRNPGFLSPALTRSNRSTPSPRMQHATLAENASDGRSLHAHNMPLVGLGTDANSSVEEERIRQERKRKIEEQRAAKKMALSVQTKVVPQSSSSGKAQLSPSSAGSLSPMDRVTTPSSYALPAQRTHRRAEPDSYSSSSTLSTKSSTSSFFVPKQNSGTLTPSSSNEQISSAQAATATATATAKVHRSQAVRKPTNSPPKRALDLQDLEGLVREIENTPASPPPQTSKKETVVAQQQKMNTLDAPTRDRSRSSSNASSVSMKSLNDRRRPLHAHVPLKRNENVSEKKKKKVCNVCLKAFERNQPMVQRDGKVLCLDDYAELYLERCRKCQEPVRTVGVRSYDGALPGLFHRECFSCLDCHASFDDGTFYVFDSAPYCAHHYHAHNGTLCQGCQTGIEGQCRQLTETGERFHIRCFTCQFDDGREFCKDLLQDYYVYGGKRLCEWHFERSMHHAKRREQNARRTNGRRHDDDDDDDDDGRSNRQGAYEREDEVKYTAAEIRAARRTTYLHTVAARKARA